MIGATTGVAKPGLGLKGLLRQVFSYEVMFTLFLASDSLELRFNPGFNITIPLLAICLAWGTLILVREGLYLHGMKVVAAFLVFFGYIVLSYSWSPSSVHRHRPDSGVRDGQYLVRHQRRHDLRQ